MPIQFTEQDTKLSFAYAINATQDTFTIHRDAEGNRTDRLYKDAVKVVARVPTNALLGILAAIETVVKSVLTALSAIPYYFTDSPLNYMKASLSLAGRATVEAFKGVAGATPAPIVIEETKEEETAPVVETSTEQPAPVVETPTQPQGMNKGKIAAFVIGAIVLGVTAYYFRANIANALFKAPIVDNRRPVAPGLLFPPTYETCAALVDSRRPVAPGLFFPQTSALDSTKDASLNHLRKLREIEFPTKPYLVMN